MRESGYSARAGFKDFDRGQIYGRPSYRGIKDLSVDQGFPNLSLSPGLSYPDGFFLLGGMKAGTVAKGGRLTLTDFDFAIALRLLDKPQVGRQGVLP